MLSKLQILDLRKISKVNEQLNNNSQKIRLECINRINGKKFYNAILNNGYVLNNPNELRRFLNRCTKIDMICIIDYLYDIDENIRLKYLSDFKSNQGRKHALSKPAWHKGLTKETDDRLINVSKSRMGSKNPMYGREVKQETRKLLSKKLKLAISEGRFTPNIHNSNTKFDIIFNNARYRSSWEAAFHSIHPELIYEYTRIQYIVDNKQRTYITDFTDIDNKIVYEIKPKSKKLDILNILKFEAAESWCSDNGYTFKIISEDYLLKHFKSIQLGNIDAKSKEKLIKLYESDKKRNN